MITFVTQTTSLSDSYRLGTIDDVVNYCSTRSVLGVDTETEGFDFTCKRMIMFQIGDEEQLAKIRDELARRKAARNTTLTEAQHAN